MQAEVSFEENDLELSPHEQDAMQEELEMLSAYKEIVDLLKIASPNDYPDERVIHNWKQNFAKIYVSTISDETDVYVWRTILRQEWKALISQQFPDDISRAEALIEKCLLFPRLDTVLYKKPAGVIPALETKIMFQSGFISEQLLISSIKEIG